MSKQQSEIGSCPSHWEVVKFSTVAELKHGYQFRSHDFTDEGVKVLKITQIKDDGSIDLSSCSYIDLNRLQAFEKNIIFNGDILMALSGATIGKIGRFKSEEIVLQNYRVGNFIPHDKELLNKDYFYYFLTSENINYQIHANQNQSAQENVGKEDILNMLVFLPPLTEQIAIASVLSSLDNKIDLLHRQNATLEKMAETLFRQWFVEEAKEEWECDTLSYFAYFFNGKSRPSEVGTIPIYGGNGVLGYTNKSNYLGKSIIVGRVGAYCGSLFYENKEIWVSDNALLVRPKIDKTTHFLFYLLKTLDLNSMAEGSSHPLLTQTLLKSIEIIIPPIQKIYEFESIVESIQSKIDSNQIQICTLTSLRDSLLPKLMSGEVTVETN